MKEVFGSFQIIYPDCTGDKAIEQIERVARTCYQSNAKMNKYSGEKLVRNLIGMGHEAMLEHFSVSVEFTTDRGVSHEIVRHRLASYAQESTRYCNYSKDKFESQITVISPEIAMKYKLGQTVTNKNGRKILIDDDVISTWLRVWKASCRTAEQAYLNLLDLGCPPELARGVLPNSLKTSIVVTMNLREWRHFFKLRTLGTTGKPHPQMFELTKPLLFKLNNYIPVVFEDLVERFKKVNPYADKSAMQSAGAEVIRSATE